MATTKAMEQRADRYIRAYAEWVRAEDQARRALKLAQVHVQETMQKRQNAWDRVKVELHNGRLHEGVYVVNETSTGDEVIHVETDVDYPEIYPLFTTRD